MSARDPKVFDAKLMLLESDRDLSPECKVAFLEDLFRTFQQHTRERQENFFAYIATHGTHEQKRRFATLFREQGGSTALGRVDIDAEIAATGIAAVK